jgi:hypothetical protein
MKPRTYIEYVLNETNKFNLQSSIFNKTIYIVTFTTYVPKKMFEQKRFAGRHLLTFESQKLNYFGKKGGRRFDITMYFVFEPCPVFFQDF